jgi:hypothetical protein
VRAHERRAWEVLGYETWEEYVRAEFNMSRSRSYQLLDQGRVVREIEAAASTDVDISEADARDLKSDLADVVDEVRDATAGLPPERRKAAARRVVKAKRKEPKKSRPPTRRELERRAENAVARATEQARRAGAPMPDMDAIRHAVLDRVPVPQAVREALAAANNFGPAAAEQLAEQDAEDQQLGLDQIVIEFGYLIDTLTAHAAELLDVEHPPLHARLRLGQQKTLGEWYVIVAASSARDRIVEALEKAQTDIASIIERLEAA